MSDLEQAEGYLADKLNSALSDLIGQPMTKHTELAVIETTRAVLKRHMDARLLEATESAGGDLAYYDGKKIVVCRLHTLTDCEQKTVTIECFPIATLPVYSLGYSFGEENDQ